MLSKAFTPEGTESHRVQNLRPLLRSLCTSVPSVVDAMGAGFEGENLETQHTIRGYKLHEF
jgi:hypothetical protein